jgi:hypothetical protein
MTTRSLDVSDSEAALILHGLFEVSAKLEKAYDAAARNGDADGMRTIDGSRDAIGDLYGRLRRQLLPEGDLPTLAGTLLTAA